jgi:anti-anti-sigma regulatory factor
MARTPEWLKIEDNNLIPALHVAVARLSSAEDEMILDFSAVSRIDPAALRAMETLANAADAQAIRVVLSATNIGVYKVMKLGRLAARFSFTACSAQPVTEQEGSHA